MDHLGGVYVGGMGFSDSLGGLSLGGNEVQCSKMVCELLGSGVRKQAFAHSVLVTSYIRFSIERCTV